MKQLIKKNIFLEKSKSEYYIKNKIRSNFKHLEKSKKKNFTKRKYKQSFSTRYWLCYWRFFFSFERKV